MLALVSVVTANLLQTQKNLEFLYDIPISLFCQYYYLFIVGFVLGFILGSFNGSLVVWGGIPPFISTLGMMTAVRGIAFLYADGRPLSVLNPKFNVIGQGFFAAIPIPVWIFIIMGIVTHVILTHTKIERYICHWR